MGERLKACREKSGCSLTEAARATGVSAKYLTAIESGQLNKLPGEVYARNFLKVYSKFLGENCSECLSLYQSEKNIYTKTKKSDKVDFKKPVERISKFHLVVTPKIVRGLVIGLLALACLVYLGVKVKAIVTPPTLLISQPADNLVTKDNFINIVGQAEPEAILAINGQQIIADEEGNFNETIDLRPGINIIEVKAEKRHGQQTKKYLQVVMVEEQETEGLDN